MPYNRITVDSDMEDSDGDRTGSQVGVQQESVLDDALLGLSTSRVNGKSLGKGDLENPSNSTFQQQTKTQNYPVYQPSPTIPDPCFVAKTMPSEKRAGAASSKKSRRMCLLLTVLCVILIVVAVPIAVVLSKNSDDNAAAVDTNQGSEVDNRTPSDGSATNGDDGATNGGTADAGGATNGGNSDAGGDASGSSPSPTTAPVIDSPLLRVIQSVTSSAVLADDTTAQAKAAQWLLEYEGSYDYQGSDELRLQRYAMSVLGFSIFPSGVDTPLFGDPLTSECEWRGVTCGEISNSSLVGADYWASYGPNVTNIGSGIVTELVWAEQELTGSIPTEIALLSSLEYLDFGDNALTGSLPDELFTLTGLQRLFLHGNQLQGTLSESFSELHRLVSFYGGSNLFSGVIPRGLGSPSTASASVRPLRYLSLHHNRLQGTLPSELNLRGLFYLDLSFNNFTGSVPSDWSATSYGLTHLHHLYLDHNELSGALPVSLPYLGNGRVEQLFVNDNRLSGTFPGGYQNADFMQQLELQHNLFTAIDPFLCNQIVFNGGEVVNFKADCSVCTCQYMCVHCY